MDNYKNLKNDLQQNIVRKVKGMIKEHKKEQSLKFQPEKKEENRFFLPGKKSFVYFLIHRKEIDT